MSDFSQGNIQPVFDDIKNIEEPNTSVAIYLAQIERVGNKNAIEVYTAAIEFLAESGMSSKETFSTYRTEVEKYLQWCWQVKIDPLNVSRTDIRRYLDYSLDPQPPLVAKRSGNRFYGKPGCREPGAGWAPWSLGEDGLYCPAKTQERHSLTVLNVFYEYLLDEEILEKNPCRALLKKVRIVKYQDEDDSEIKMFDEQQWSYIVEALDEMVSEDPYYYWRVKFLVYMLYSLYLRISEVSARPGVMPWMSLFKFGDVNYYRVQSSKGNKSRRVSVSDAFIVLLEEYRTFLSLSPRPTLNELVPIFCKFVSCKGGRRMVMEPLGVRRVRELVDEVYVRASDLALSRGDASSAGVISTATVHWLRHTGISHDINIHGRPISAVRDDAGHESIETTNRYLHTSIFDRHQSTKDKPLIGQ